jgi:soluble cytochrome b562
LYCAREAAQSGQAEDLIAGIHLVETWPEDHPLHTDAQALMFDASRALLSMARATINESDLDQAVDLASQIPPQSLLYEEAQTAIARWKDIWQQGEVLYTTAQQALKDRNWDLANEQLVEMGYLDNDYWRREQTDALTQQILRERQGWEYLQQARRLATTNQPEQLAESMALLQKMSPQSYVWEDAQVDFQRWRQTLIGVGMQRWQQGNLQGAIALLRNIAPDPSLDKNVQDLVKFSHAYFLANQTNQRWQPNLQQIWNLSQAIAIADQIPSDSPLYPQVEASLETWQLSLQDLNQLQVASIVADLGNRRSLELAIQQAQAISVDRPRRVQAQTLIAHWQLGIQRLEDQPILDRAYALAASETIPALQAAITQAQEIPLGRALRLDAQTAIAQWRGKIQAIEDQPMLDEATALAEAGRWEDAIRSAQRIQQGRSLYDDAQAAIAQWRGEIQSALIAQDRTILNEANALAAKEWYTAAIDRASQIGANRPLYGEAQASIAQWRSARSAFLNQRSTSAPSASSSSPPSGGGYYSPGYSQ